MRKNTSGNLYPKIAKIDYTSKAGYLAEFEKLKRFFSWDELSEATGMPYQLLKYYTTGKAEKLQKWQWIINCARKLTRQAIDDIKPILEIQDYKF